jgi:hypothetical protein
MQDKQDTQRESYKEANKINLERNCIRTTSIANGNTDINFIIYTS